MNGWVLFAMHLTFVGDLADYEPPSTHASASECSQRLMVVRGEMIEADLDRVLICDPIGSESDIGEAREFYWNEYVSPFRG